MIKMIKYGAISFHLRIDINGIEEMLEYIEKLGNKDKVNLQIQYLGKNRNFEIELNNDVDKLLVSEKLVKIYMDDEEFEYFEQRLKDSLTSSYFYPSEICEKYYNNRYATIYCDVMLT